MIDKADVIEFFDRCAPSWDAGLIRSDRKINIILDNAGVREGSRVLDVACGTGVLIPDYIRRGADVTGIDISPEMIKLAERKYAGTGVRFICGDIETADVGQGFDAIVVYNAFPHFPDPERLITHLSGLLAEGGRAHRGARHEPREDRRAPSRLRQQGVDGSDARRTACGDIRQVPGCDRRHLRRGYVSGRGQAQIKQIKFISLKPS